MLAPFEEATGITVNYEGLADYETVLATRVDGGNAPDLAQTAQPATMRAFAEDGALVPLSDWINMDQIEADYLESFIDLASVDGTMYGLFFNASLKSIVWYPVQAFADAGYEIPTTWDELVALSDQIIADGNGNPWCISVEHGDVSGWVATDWIEDILLRTAPVGGLRPVGRPRDPVQRPGGARGRRYMSEIWFAPDYVFGGNTGINATFVGDTQTPMFAPMARSAGCTSRRPGSPTSGPRAPSPARTAPSSTSRRSRTSSADRCWAPATSSSCSRTGPRCGRWSSTWRHPRRPSRGSSAAGSCRRTVRSRRTGTRIYPDTDLAAILAEADTLRFDAGDSMAGGPVFNSGMVDWIAANGEGTEDVFAEIEANWPE